MAFEIAAASFRFWDQYGLTICRRLFAFNWREKQQMISGNGLHHQENTTCPLFTNRCFTVISLPIPEVMISNNLPCLVKSAATKMVFHALIPKLA